MSNRCEVPSDQRTGCSFLDRIYCRHGLIAGHQRICDQFPLVRSSRESVRQISVLPMMVKALITDTFGEEGRTVREKVVGWTRNRG